MPDWSILQQTPNFAQAALSGYAAGQNIRKQREMDSALQAVDLERPESLLPLLKADPATGAALIGASVKLHAENRAINAQKAIGNVIGGYMSGQAPVVPQGPSETPAGEGITVTANRPKPTIENVVGQLVQSGASIEEATQFVGLASKLNDAQAKALADQQDALGRVAGSIPQGATPEQARAYIQANRDFLLAHHVPAEKIDGFDPTPQNIMAVQRMALTTKDAIEVARQAAQDEETRRSHLANEANQAGHLAVARGQLGVSQGALGLARQKEGRAAKGGAGGKIENMSDDALIAVLTGGR